MTSMDESAKIIILSEWGIIIPKFLTRKADFE